jgi:hypothetical protein
LKKFEKIEKIEKMTSKLFDLTCDIEMFKSLLLSYFPEEEHTLLTFFCYTASNYKNLDSPIFRFEEKLKLIIDHGYDPKGVVGVGKKTGLSYLVKQKDIYPVKVYIKLGGDYSLGHLLVNCILGNNNYTMFEYLCSLRLDPNEIEPCTGMNSLNAICSLNHEILLNILIKNYTGLFQLDINPLLKNFRLNTRLDIFTHTKKSEFDELMYKVHENAVDNRFTDIYLLGSKKVVGEFIGSPFIKL